MFKEEAKQHKSKTRGRCRIDTPAPTDLHAQGVELCPAPRVHNATGAHVRSRGLVLPVSFKPQAQSMPVLRVCAHRATAIFCLEIETRISLSTYRYICCVVCSVCTHLAQTRTLTPMRMHTYTRTHRQHRLNIDASTLSQTCSTQS